MTEIMATLAGIPVYYDFSIGTITSTSRTRGVKTMECIVCGAESQLLCGVYYYCPKCPYIYFPSTKELVNSYNWKEQWVIE